MSLNQLLKNNAQLLLNTGSVKTDLLKIKMKNGSYINFVLPDLGNESEVLTTDSRGNLKWINNDSNVSTVFCCQSDTKTLFETELNLTPYFTPLRKGNYILNDNSKVLLKTSLIYMWDNDELPIDFEVKIFINNIEVSSSTQGLSDFSGVWNKLSTEILLDVKKDDIISIKLSKVSLDSSNFIIRKNSFYSIESM